RRDGLVVAAGRTRAVAGAIRSAGGVAVLAGVVVTAIRTRAISVGPARRAFRLVALAAGLIGEPARLLLPLRRDGRRPSAPVECALRSPGPIGESLLALLDQEGRALARPEPGDPAAV